MVDIKISKPQTLIVVPVFVENFYKVILSNAKKNRKKKLLKRIIKISNLSLKMNIDLRSKLFASIISEFGGNLHTLSVEEHILMLNMSNGFAVWE